jgi:hypothetical protein
MAQAGPSLFPAAAALRSDKSWQATSVAAANALSLGCLKEKGRGLKGRANHEPVAIRQREGRNESHV